MAPKKIPQTVHGIETSQIDVDALKVVQKLRDSGYTAYLVGGCIRDLLLHKTPKDYDISTSAKPEEIKAIFRNCILIGRRFRLAHIHFGKKILEVSTFRKGDNDTDELILRDNVWGTEEEDVIRRDFTINGLFYDSATENIIDYVNGYEDIQNQTLKTIGQPFVRFKQDPVRMIRCLRFEARFGLNVEKETRQALLECRKEIIKSSQARVLEELFKMLENGSSKNFFKLMTDHGLMETLLTELAHFLESKEGNEIYSFLDEMDMIMHEPGIEKPSRPVLLCSLVFPLLDRYLKTHIEKNPRSLHLGQIQSEVFVLIDQIFRPFFVIPKKIKATMASILTSQYRLTPLDMNIPRRIRIPKTPDFNLALEFFTIRARLEPGLQTILADWMDAFAKYEPNKLAKPKRRRPFKKRIAPPAP